MREEDVVADSDGDGTELVSGARIDGARDGGMTVDLARYGALRHLDDDLAETMGIGASLGKERTDPAGTKEDPGAAEIGGHPTPPRRVAVHAIPDGEAEVEPRGARQTLRRVLVLHRRHRPHAACEHERERVGPGVGPPPRVPASSTLHRGELGTEVLGARIDIPSATRTHRFIQLAGNIHLSESLQDPGQIGPSHEDTFIGLYSTLMSL